MRAQAAILATATLAALGLPSAHAATTTKVVERTFRVELAPSRTITGHVRATAVLTSGSTFTGLVQCDAVSIGDVPLTTGIGCTLYSNAGANGRVDAPFLTFPGAASASAGTGTIGSGYFEMCVYGIATFGPVTGTAYFAPPCTAASLL